MIKILSSGGIRLGVIKNAITASRLEEINGENTLDFEAVLDGQLASLISEESMYELDDELFDTALFLKSANEDGTYSVTVESEQVSYRLNREEYNKEYFTELGTPTYILGKILEGTGFTVGTVEFSAETTYSAQEAKSRRQILMEFVAYIEGEVQFNKYEVNILQHRGSTTAKPVLRDRNVKVISKQVNKRAKDDLGNDVVSYKCTPMYLPGDSYSLGDDIHLINIPLSITEVLRVVRITYNPYEKMEAAFEFSNYTNDLASSLYRIMTTAVTQDKLYNGSRIGPQYGFESVRNDKMARAYFRSDGFKFQSGDGTGENWKDRLYYEYDSETDETVLVFDGKLSAGMIEALEATFDITISNTVITNTLSAVNADIAQLTVDRWETSQKVKRFLDGNTAPDDFIRGQGQKIDFITAIAGEGENQNWENYPNSPDSTSTYPYQCICKNAGNPELYDSLILHTHPLIFTGTILEGSDGAGGAEVPKRRKFIKATGEWDETLDDSAELVSNVADLYEANKDVFSTIELTTVAFEKTTTPSGGVPVHYQNRDGAAMYWTDDTRTKPTTNVTEWPIYIYDYDELVKMAIEFYDNGTNKIPRILMGVGSGDGDKGKGSIEKVDGGLLLKYTKYDGSVVTLLLGEGGLVLDGTVSAITSLRFFTNGFDIIYADESVKEWDFETNSNGFIAQLYDVSADRTIPINWTGTARP